MIAGVPQLKASNSRPGNRRAWASEVTRDPPCQKGWDRQNQGTSAKLSLAGCVGDPRRDTAQMWPGPTMSPHAAGWAGSCLPCLQCLPSPLSHAKSWDDTFSWDVGHTGDRLWERSPIALPSSLSLALPTMPPGQASGERTPGRWAGGTLRDQHRFSGQGGAWTTIWQCCVVLMLCCPLWPPPCTCRKYLRDADRQVLAQRAFILTVKVLEDTLSELSEVHCLQPPPLPGGGHLPPLTHQCP